MSDDLNEFIEKIGSEIKKDDSNCDGPETEAGSSILKCGKVPHNDGGFSQWLISAGDTYISSQRTINNLPVGSYSAAIDDYGRVHLQKVVMVTDELLRLPDSASAKVLNSIDIFWSARDKFISRKQLHKRGIILWGPPGSGKTVTVMLLIENIIKRGGIVLICKNPNIASEALRIIRLIEPSRPLIVVEEDIDELINNYGESGILSLLDGENQINNVVHLATTNYPERLDSRIVNRPSRFDEVIKIGMPSIEARRFYLRTRVSQDEMNDEDLEKWVIDTHDLSVAHLKELVIAIFCLGREYDETIERLKKMKSIPNSYDGSKLGFGK
jgi:hypothetical protein